MAVNTGAPGQPPAGPVDAAAPVPAGGGPDGPALDLSPRTPSPGKAPGGRSAWRALVLVGVVVVAVGFVLVRGLGDATLFFYNVDEAVAKRDDLADRRFRLQGNVIDGSVTRTAAGADFVLTFNGVEADVRHQGDLPQLFQPGIPVVLEGAWDGQRFASDRMLVKHSEVYTADHPDRVDGYDADGDDADAGGAGAPAAAGAAGADGAAAGSSGDGAPGGGRAGLGR